MSNESVALITGASSGFGREIARSLKGRGYRVFGTSRHPGASDVGAEMVALDVRSQESVGACVRTVLDAAGKIDVLVNNAGVAHVSLIEETDLDAARAVIETNFFGTVCMTNAVLPSMRARRSGRIINIASLAGLVGVPAEGFYAASKFALEGYSEALRYEVERLGISVTLVEPGFYRTNLDKSIPPEGRRIEDYDGIRETLKRSFGRSFHSGGDPAEVGELVARIAESSAPRLHYRIGGGARSLPYLRTLLPQAAFAIGFRKRFDLRTP
jgi:NAD(P)-dependent dehydrogenase (short-subunit alcohol dehydrogenase family)